MKIFTKLLPLVLLPVVAAAQGIPIMAVQPAANTPNVSGAAPISITFARALSAGREAGIRVFGNKRTGRQAGVFTGGGTTALSFQPAAAFMPGELVTVTVPPTVAGTAKNWQFMAATLGGTATFTTGPTLPTGQGACNNGGTTTADLNGDGRLDILNANASSSSIGIYLSNSAGQLSAPTDVPVLLAPQDIVVADIDNDGDLDLLSPSYQMVQGFSFRFNDGTGHFSGGGDIYYPADCATENITVADLDTDGYLDVVTSNSSMSNSVGFCRNLGNGTFAPVQLLRIPEPRFLNTGDVNGDGAVDILVARGYSSNGWSSSPAAVVAFINDGSGNFNAGPSFRPAIWGTYDSPMAMQSGDVDGDGDLDVLVSSGGRFADVGLNDGNGNFSAGQRVSLAGAVSSKCLAMGDLDGDGDLDFVADGLASGQSGNPDVLSVRLNDGSGQFYNAPDVATPESSRAITLADTNGDGALDIICAAGAGYLALYYNQLAQSPVLVTPGQGFVGSIATLTGTGLQGTTAVSFNGTPAPGFVVNAAGTTITVTVPAGTRSGRVMLTSASGTAFSSNTFTVLTPTAVRNTSGGLVTGIYPNPAQAHVTLSLIDNADILHLELLDQLGRSVLRRTILHPTARQPLDVSLASVPPGFYILRLTNGSTSTSRRLEKQK